MFSTLTKTEILILATSILSSASAFNLMTSKILSFGKELTVYHNIVDLPYFRASAPYKLNVAEQIECHWKGYKQFLYFFSKCFQQHSSPGLC